MRAAGAPRRGPIRAGTVVMVAIAASITLATASAGELGVEGGRIDLGALARGDTATGSFLVHNSGGSAADVLIEVTNDPGSAVTFSPAATAVPARGSVAITVTVMVPDQADPGRHEPSINVRESTSPGGNVAATAVRVPILFQVAAVDVAHVSMLDNQSLFVRTVNGHAGDRTIRLDITLGAGANQQALTPDAGSTTAGASHLTYWIPDWAALPDGDHTLVVSGTATGGAEGETFDHTATITVAGGVPALTSAPPKPTPTGGGSGAVRTPESVHDPHPPDGPAPGDDGEAPRPTPKLGDLPWRPTPGAPGTGAAVGAGGANVPADEAGRADGAVPTGAGRGVVVVAALAIGGALGLSAVSGLRHAFRHWWGPGGGAGP